MLQAFLEKIFSLKTTTTTTTTNKQKEFSVSVSVPVLAFQMVYQVVSDRRL